MARNTPVPSRRSRHPLRGIIYLLIVLTGLWYWVQRQLDRPFEHGAATRVITVVSGSSGPQIARQLTREGVIRTEWPVLIWLRTSGRGLRLKAGDYLFKSPISPRQALEQVARGQVVTRSLTIPEGYNRYDIARLLADIPGLREPAMTPEQVLGLLDRSELIRDLDATAKSLEGYLFPDTYEYTTSTTRAQMVEQMVGRFRRVFTEPLQRQADQKGLTVREVVTMASLIEKEARLDRERELISAVFHRRLRERVPLACDPTVIYAALLAGKYRGKIYRSDLDRDSPYNTYRNPGLPPGPIASPGRRSIEAALNPAPVDYLYFVVDATRNDGSHLFSTRSSDHEAAVRRLRQAEAAGAGRQ